MADLGTLDSITMRMISWGMTNTRCPFCGGDVEYEWEQVGEFDPEVSADHACPGHDEVEVAERIQADLDDWTGFPR